MQVIFSMFKWLEACNKVQSCQLAVSILAVCSCELMFCFAVTQILLDDVTNPTFDDIQLSNEPINSDIVLSPDKTHLYAMTNTTVWRYFSLQ